MNWVQLLILILELLKQFKDAQSEEAAMAAASIMAPEMSGDLLKWLWENREEILAFILKLVEMFTATNPVRTQDAEMDLLLALAAELKG